MEPAEILDLINAALNLEFQLDPGAGRPGPVHLDTLHEK